MHRIHGIRLRTDLPVHGLIPNPGGEWDICIETGVGSIDPVVGERLLACAGAGGYELRAACRGAVFRFPDAIDARFDTDTGRMAVTRRHDTSPEFAAILAHNAAIAAYLTLRGAFLLHASCVVWEGRAIAFVGASGSGKSSLAAHLCQQDAELVADDALRVDRRNGVAVVFAAGTELRLRSGAIVVDAPLRNTVDGRLAMACATPGSDVVELRAIVLPRIEPGLPQPVVRACTGGEAFTQVSRFPRIVGWTDDAIVSNHFDRTADLVETVPVFAVALTAAQLRTPNDVRDVFRSIADSI